MRLVEVLYVVACDVVLRLLVVDVAGGCDATDVLQLVFIRSLRWRRIVGIIVMLDILILLWLLDAAADL